MWRWPEWAWLRPCRSARFRRRRYPRSDHRASARPEPRRASRTRPRPRRNPLTRRTERPSSPPDRRLWASFLDRCRGSTSRTARGDRSSNPDSLGRVNGPIGRRRQRREGHSSSRLFLRSGGPRCLRRPSEVWNCPRPPARSMDRQCRYRRPRVRSCCLSPRPRPRPRSDCPFPCRPYRCPRQRPGPRTRLRSRHRCPLPSHHPRENPRCRRRGYR